MQCTGKDSVRMELSDDRSVDRVRAMDGAYF